MEKECVYLLLVDLATAHLPDAAAGIISSELVTDAIEELPTNVTYHPSCM